MAFNMSRMTILKAMEPKKWKVEMQKSIIKHRGVGLHIAQDLGIGISTLKRWIENDAALIKLMEHTRRAAKAA